MPAVEKREQKFIHAKKRSTLPRTLHQKLKLMVSRLPQPFLLVDSKYQFYDVTVLLLSHLVLGSLPQGDTLLFSTRDSHSGTPEDCFNWLPQAISAGCFQTLI